MGDDGAMKGGVFTSLEIDTIGEIMNISMGSAATAASTLLDNKVNITTPVVKLVPIDEFEITQFIPAIAVDIRYVEGISGSNILILRKEDVRKILSQMMMTEIAEDFEIDALAESAICELMNQMMGSSATVLSCFLGRSINISTPQTVGIDMLEQFKKEHFSNSDSILTIEFTITITGIMESKFVSVMNVDLAKEIIDVSLNFDSSVQADDRPASGSMPMAPGSSGGGSAMPPSGMQAIPGLAAPPQPFSQMPPAAAQAPAQPNYSQMPQHQNPYPQQPPYPPQYMYPPQGYAMPPQAYAQQPISVKSYDYGDFSDSGSLPEHAANMDLVMDVPVLVTVELGRTKRKIKEILEFGQGSIIELDKQAGSQVDVVVNGQLIARGDVVVVDDNFSIRITEILKNRDKLSLL